MIFEQNSMGYTLLCFIGFFNKPMSYPLYLLCAYSMTHHDLFISIAGRVRGSDAEFQVRAVFCVLLDFLNNPNGGPLSSPNPSVYTV